MHTSSQNRLSLGAFLTHWEVKNLIDKLYNNTAFYSCIVATLITLIPIMNEWFSMVSQKLFCSSPVVTLITWILYTHVCIFSLKEEMKLAQQQFATPHRYSLIYIIYSINGYHNMVVLHYVKDSSTVPRIVICYIKVSTLPKG